MGKAKNNRKVDMVVQEIADPKPGAERAGGAERKLSSTAAACRGMTTPLLAVGAELPVLQDYLDMEAVPPSDEGMPHAGYLVLRRGEVIRLLYIGSAEKGDAGWLYAEVLRTASRVEPVGRRGWMPTKSLEPPTVVPTPAPTLEALQRDQLKAEPRGSGGPPKAPTSPTAGLNAASRMRGLGKPTRSPPEPPPPEPPGERRLGGPGSPTSGSGGGTHLRHTQRQQQGAGGGYPRSQEAFPALAGGRQPPSPPAWLPETPQKPAVPRTMTTAEKKKEIERQRAAAAEAAAAAKASQTFAQGQTCPICAETYNSASGRRPLRRPCCHLELCAQCDHRSLRSGKCYFCRDPVDEFPSLGLSCRVAS